MEQKHINDIADILYKEAMARTNLHFINERALLQDLVVAFCMYFMEQNPKFNSIDFIKRVWDVKED